MKNKNAGMKNKVIVQMLGVSLIFLICCAASAQAAEIKVEPACQVVAGGEFTVNISVYPEGTQVSGVQYTLYFNNSLLNATSQVNGSFLSQDGIETSVDPNEINNSFNSTHGKIDYGECRVGVNYGVTNPGVLAIITFEAIADEGFTNITIDEDWLWVSDPYGASIPTNITNGSVRVGLCGDANDDGYVTVGDVTDVFYDTYKNEWAADVNGEGSVTVGDVTDLFNDKLNCRCGW